MRGGGAGPPRPWRRRRAAIRDDNEAAGGRDESRAPCSSRVPCRYIQHVGRRITSQERLQRFPAESRRRCQCRRRHPKTHRRTNSICIGSACAPRSAHLRARPHLVSLRRACQAAHPVLRRSTRSAAPPRRHTFAAPRRSRTGPRVRLPPGGEKRGSAWWPTARAPACQHPPRTNCSKRAPVRQDTDAARCRCTRAAVKLPATALDAQHARCLSGGACAYITVAQKQAPAHRCHR